MTQTSDAIGAFRSVQYVALDSDIERRILEPLRRDRQRGATVAALIADGTAQRLIRGLRGDDAIALIQLLAGACDRAGAERLRRTLRESRPSDLWLFDLSHDLHHNYRRQGLTTLAAPHSTVTPVVPVHPGQPFTGGGATGRSPGTVGVPVADQVRMFLGDAKVRRRYSNPIGTLDYYLHRLTAEQRRRQGEILTQLPISSAVPYSYAVLPSRLSVLRAAAHRYDLHAELVAAFVLAEQRDQSQLEDGKDYVAATSLARANTSIGLGQ